MCAKGCKCTGKGSFGYAIKPNMTSFIAFSEKKAQKSRHIKKYFISLQANKGNGFCPPWYAIKIERTQGC